jgi:cation diffusion facilitator CzcD-associated flavoprotein CzcO
MTPEAWWYNAGAMSNQPSLPLLIVGAGPFGLALAAYAGGAGIDHLVVGRPMDFWKSNMPERMMLRSACDWHLDPFNEHTIEHYLQTLNLQPADVEPLSLDFYLAYCKWFQQQKGITVEAAWIEQLNVLDGQSAAKGARYEAVLQDGRSLFARNVVLALGFRYFRNIPERYTTLFPENRLAHTCDLVDLAALRGKRVLIIGGRQSAFEWAALLNEEAAAAVYLSYRHATPAFLPADWSWVTPLVDGMVTNPGWFRGLAVTEKEGIIQRMWGEGRLKLEPWLAERISQEQVHLLPQTEVVACRRLPGDELEVTLDDGTTFVVDQVVLATGYKVNVSRIPFLSRGNVLARLVTHDGFPVLDNHFQSNLPGLFFTSMCATQAFGPFFAFTVSVRASAEIIGGAIRQSIHA